MSLEGTASEDQIVAVSGEAIVAARQVLDRTIKCKIREVSLDGSCTLV
jgi:hypothetical protein